MLNGTNQIRTIETPAIRLIRADRMLLEQHWPFIRRKLIELKRKYARRAPLTKLRWSPEQVRFGIVQGFSAAGTVELFLAVDTEDAIRAFAVTECAADPFRHVPIDMFIWLLWSDSRPVAGIRNARVLESALALLEEIARERGLIGIKHMSPFIGWGRRTREMGFDLEYIVWRKRLVEEE